MRVPTTWYVRIAKALIRLRLSRSCRLDFFRTKSVCRSMGWGGGGGGRNLCNFQFIINNCKNPFLSGAKLCMDLPLYNSLPSHAHIMEYIYCILYDDSWWPDTIGVIFKNVPTTFNFSSLFVHHAVGLDIPLKGATMSSLRYNPFNLRC